ncbi:MAG TPA: MFS transporter [Actinomycetota bacterium]|nr:MFS transporter [Actinomycetota bacterium]
MTPLLRLTTRTFQSLRVRNYRWYFFAQIISMSGTWMQSVAQGWLVLKITDSGVALGVTAALQFLPVLLFGAWGGVIADRFDKRKTLVATQVAFAILAVALGGLESAGIVRLWMVYVLSLLFGFVSVIDIPVRQSFVVEMVGPQDLSNAVGLNSAIFTSARVIGPAIAGILISTVGIAICFYVNGASYAAVIVGLMAMDATKLSKRPRVSRAPGQVREGFRYIWSNPKLRHTLMMLAIIGTFSFNFSVLLPLLAKFVFHGGAGLLATMTSVMGAGALIGALTTAARNRPTRKMLHGSAAIMGVALLLAGIAPTLGLELVLLAVMGGASIAFVSTANSTLQLTSEDAMRGRVMAMYSVVIVGSSPLGGPLLGWIAEHLGPRAGLQAGGIAALVAVLLSWILVARSRREPQHARAFSDQVSAEPAVLP